jgi:hypothetical protein
MRNYLLVKSCSHCGYELDRQDSALVLGYGIDSRIYRAFHSVATGSFFLGIEGIYILKLTTQIQLKMTVRMCGNFTCTPPIPLNDTEFRKEMHFYLQRIRLV